MAQIQGLLGTKIGMTQIFSELGDEIPVTVVKVGPCTVVQIKRDKSDGYNAVQLGFGSKKQQLATKPLIGHCTKAGKGVFQVLREVRVDNPDDFQVGDQLTADMFSTGDLVSVSARSKGKGFAGPMKRWGFKGLSASHGTHKVHRSAGSVGTSAWPGRVWPGKKMAGHMGNQVVTVKNMIVIGVRPEQGILLIKGAVPGSKNGVVFLKKL